MLFIFLFLFKFILILICILLSVAFFTLLERKVLSIVGVRLGPTKVSFYGFLQPITDAVKLANKQVNYSSNFSFFFYYISAMLMLFSSLLIWSCSCLFPGVIFFKLSILSLMIILGFNSFNSILAGWSTFSKYSLIGSIRTVSQLISYESVLYFCFFVFILVFSTFNLFNFQFFSLENSFFIFPFLLYIWLPSVLADLNRTPYDFSEGESELVSGFNTEFGSKSFTFIFLSEYSNILFFCLLTSFLFFSPFIFLYSVIFFFSVIWIRSVLPRFRFDLLMSLAWKFLIPFVTVFFISYFYFLEF